MRLIDAEPIEKFIEDGLNNPDKLKAFGHDAIEILTEIHFASTIDPASLRPKGEWGDGRYRMSDGAYEEQCTHCRNWSFEYGKPFCPNCGADMRGETHDS